jgi:mannose-1-phosphate guanylyltransferase
MYRHIWAIVLAAGEGSRLRALTTTPDGRSVPKQFCSLLRGPSLLQEAIDRAHRITSPTRTCVVVAAHHSALWERTLRLPDPSNLIVQSCNRGTAHGILLPTLQILARDPEARVVVLPSDHYVSHESRLARALRRAVHTLCGPEIVLLGMDPEYPDPELGYIVPHLKGGESAAEVQEFVEKPSLDHARRLLEQGALWNAFIFGGRATSLVDLYRRRYPDMLALMESAVMQHQDSEATENAIAQVFEQLPHLDFSRHVLQGAERRLRVMRVPACGWSDLGTPARVAAVLQRMQSRITATRATHGVAPALSLGHADLAAARVRSTAMMNSMQVGQMMQ